MSEPLHPTKEPWLAVNLSFLVPGLGQLYARAWGLGLIFLLFGQLLPVAFLWAFLCPRGILTVGFLALLMMPGLVVADLLLAHSFARKRNSPEAEAERKRTRDPYLAAFLSQIIPGVGHLYLGRTAVGVVTLITLLLLVVLPLPLLMGVLPDCPALAFLVAFMLTGVFTAGMCFLAWRAGPLVRRHGSAGIILICLLLAGRYLLIGGGPFLLRQYVVEAFSIPTGAMAPTIEVGERILALKTAFQPSRGDIIVFRSPTNRKQFYVKRVVAIEGERIEFKADGIYVNGDKLSDGPFGRIPYVAVFAGDQKFAGEGQPYTVPAGHVFVGGDNMAKSFDSRFFGPVPVSDVIGKAYKRYWPPSRAGPID